MADKKVPAGGWAGGQGEKVASGCSPRHHHTIGGHDGQVYAQGRVVGQVRGDVFCKGVRSSIHQLRQPPAWALDIESILQAERLGARRVRLYDRDAGTTYTASLDLVRRRGFTLDRGHGRQVALPLEFWTVARPGEPVAEQLTLFEGVAP